MKERVRKGDVCAMMNLALSVLDSDPSESRNLFRRAGKKGLREGCWAAGFCFLLGIGGERNMEKVWEWFEKGSNASEICETLDQRAYHSFLPLSLHFNGLSYFSISLSSNRKCYFSI